MRHLQAQQTKSPKPRTATEDGSPGSLGRLWGSNLWGVSPTAVSGKGEAPPLPVAFTSLSFHWPSSCQLVVSLLFHMFGLPIWNSHRLFSVKILELPKILEVSSAPIRHSSQTIRSSANWEERVREMTGSPYILLKWRSQAATSQPRGERNQIFQNPLRLWFIPTENLFFFFFSFWLVLFSVV